jgi:alkylation response protein AidB-like acyl-CoA dehydrogenase
MLIMEAFGRALVVEPYLQTVIIAGGLLSRGGGGRSAELVQEIIAGKAIFAFAQAEPQSRHSLRDIATTAQRRDVGWRLDGRKSVVIAAPIATHLIVTARTGGSQWEAQGISLFVVPANAPGLERHDYVTVDGHRAAELLFDAVQVSAADLIGTEGDAISLVEQIVDRARVGLCAEAVGCMKELCEQTITYTKQRRQFGRALADFQALQHRMVDMCMAVEQAASMTHLATLRLDNSPPERSMATAAAKFQIGRAARFVGQSAIQLHGGMGMTDELAVGQYFKRVTVIEEEFGSPDHHLKRYIELSMPVADGTADAMPAPSTISKLARSY